MMKMLLMVGLGSFAGGVLRFLLTRFVQINSMSSFPWGTTAVNLLGCLVLGDYQDAADSLGARVSKDERFAVQHNFSGAPACALGVDEARKRPSGTGA